MFFLINLFYLQGKANGNKAALKVRAFLHHKLFWIGCYIQRNASVVMLIGIIALTACSVGLKFAHMETNIEKLWVESKWNLLMKILSLREMRCFFIVVITYFFNFFEQFLFWNTYLRTTFKLGKKDYLLS